MEGPAANKNHVSHLRKSTAKLRSYTGKPFDRLIKLWGWKNTHLFIRHERSSAFRHEKFISTKLGVGHILIWPHFAASVGQTSTQQRCSGLGESNTTWTFSSYRQQEHSPFITHIVHVEKHAFTCLCSFQTRCKWARSNPGKLFGCVSRLQSWFIKLFSAPEGLMI